MLKLNSSDFNDVYHIMEQSFISDEFRPYHEQYALLSNSRYNLFGLRGSDQALQAFMAIWQFEAFAFLEHFAVSPAYRGGGIGAHMLKEVLSQLSCRICLEVEPPNNDIRQRRIAFYQRHGYYLNDYPYIQPAISKGKQPIPLLIMSSHGPLSENEFVDFRCVIYQHVYHVQ